MSLDVATVSVSARLGHSRVVLAEFVARTLIAKGVIVAPAVKGSEHFECGVSQMTDEQLELELKAVPPGGVVVRIVDFWSQQPDDKETNENSTVNIDQER